LAAVDQQRLGRCLNPKSIAVVGGKEAARVVEQSLKLGFEGDIWPVNPNRDVMHGLPCFRSQDDLPEPPDVTFIAIPADPSIESIEKLNLAGAGGAICYSSGFREVGDEGVSRHNRLLKAATGMPVFGPNCHGFINTLSGAALWPDLHGLSRNTHGVAVFSSSGNVSINLTLQQRGLAIAWLVTVGNQAMVGIEDGMAAALENDNITAIGIHIEGLNNLPLFVEVADKARLKGIPIIALKTGKSDIGARITLSHTATMAGENRLYTALFDRLGVGQVDTLEEFLEALKLASVTGVLAGNRISSMSCSGGEASLIADLAVNRELSFPEIESKFRGKLQATLNEYVNIDNPLDYHTFIWGDRNRMTATFSAMMEPGYDLNLLVIDIPYITGADIDEWEIAIQSLVDASIETGSKAAVVISISESLNKSVREKLIQNGIVPLNGMQQALAAIDAVSRIGITWNSNWILPDVPVPSVALEPAHVYGMDEYQAKQWLQNYGIGIPESRLVQSGDEAVQAASSLGYPVVLKVISSDIVHKSELNAVVVGIATEYQLRTEAERLLEFSNKLLLEEMIGNSVAELLIGVSYDPQFGHYLIVGFGGTMVELIDDSEILMLPINREIVIEALHKLKTWPLLNGYRGNKLADVDSVVATVLSVAELVEQNKDKLVELEINPLIVKSENCGVVSVDAMVRMKN
jgi:acyl-CoA synthetase (NDP forming)